MTGLTRAARLSPAMLYLGFAATGVAVALPGAVLPALLRQWSLGDGQAGFLFFLGWAGSSVGALLVRGSRARSLVLGCLLISLAAVGVAAAGPVWARFASMAALGVGLGVAMTSISLLRAGRNAARRGRELNRLNLVWAAGACLCPSLAAHSLRIANVREIFSGVAAFFLLLGLWTALFERDNARVVAGAAGWTFSLAAWPLALVVLIVLPGGVESSIGGWAATYMQRAHGALATTVSAGTCFWGGLLLSRALHSTRLLEFLTERSVLRHSLGIVALGALLLIASGSALAILPGVFLIGFGLGPVYPLLLALVLGYSENPLIFTIAGLGSAFLPWLTGAVSASASSLRLGLLVPLAASLLMLALGLRLPHRSPAAAP